MCQNGPLGLGLKIQSMPERSTRFNQENLTQSVLEQSTRFDQEKLFYTY